MVFLPPITCSFVECGIEPCGVADAKITLNTVGIGRKRWRSRTEEGDTRVDYYWRLKAPTNYCNETSLSLSWQHCKLHVHRAPGVGRH